MYNYRLVSFFYLTIEIQTDYLQLFNLVFKNYFLISI